MWSYVKSLHERRFYHNLELVLILAIYLVLAILYSLVVPIGRGADEWAHYWYAQFIAQNSRLPANPAEREAAGYKSDWPPLYHLGAAALTGWIESDGPPTFKYRIDPLTGMTNIRRQLVPGQGSDAILHTEDELFPWQQEILVWHLGRFLSIGFSLGTLLVTYRIALEVFQSSKVAGSKVAGGQGGRGAGENVSRFAFRVSRFTPQTLALVSVAFLAFIPRFLFTGMVFGYDSLTLLFASLFLWLALRVAKGYHRRWGFLALGAVAGLALTTKYLAALLPLEIGLLILSRGWKAGEQGSGGAGEQGGGEVERHARGKTFYVLPLLQAALAYVLVTSWWFGYLLFNFNEVGRYGPVLGILAPLLRGDGSDRTVEQLFAWISGGQAPPLAHIDQPSYSVWQILTELPLTFWVNPIVRPYQLNWFVGLMTVIAGVAAVGLVRSWRSNSFSSLQRIIITFLLLHCLLPAPFMVIRLFGARDALEAVQGRHLLFLSGPALAILVVWGLSRFTIYGLRFTIYNIAPFGYLRFLPHTARFTLYALIGLLLVGAISQLIDMANFYPPPLPVRTTFLSLEPEATPTSPITLEHGTKLVSYRVTPGGNRRWLAFPTHPAALKVSLIWRAGARPAPEDYLVELALVDRQGQTQTSWLAYQTQARYPTRAWEAGDVIRDEGWLPLTGVPAGNYEVRWRLWDENKPVVDWQTLTTYQLVETANPPSLAGWLLWRDGVIAPQPPLLYERETAQITFPHPQSLTPNSKLTGPDGVTRSPASLGPTWANFIIGPDWPAGDYRLQPAGEVVLRVAKNERNFQAPVLTHPLEANFEGQVKLLGYDLPVRRVQPGEGAPLTLYWQGQHWMGENLVIFDRLLDNQGVAWGGYDRLARENYSTLLWAPGEVIADGFAVPVAPDTPDGIYTLSLGWYRQVNGAAKSLLILDPATGQPTEASAVTIGPIKVGGPQPGATVATATPQTEVNIVLGEQIKLLGFDDAANGESRSDSPPPRLPARFASSLRLTLYWQALTAPENDYTVFTHVRNAAGETVAQKDGPPAGGVYPTGLWDAGEIIKDEVSISLDALKLGRYDLVVGMYDFATGVRLPVADSPDNVIVLSSFEIVEK